MSYQEPKLPSRRPDRTKVTVRKINPFGGVGINANHTSFRLNDEDRRKLKILAQNKYGGVTMTAVIRILIRDEAIREGIE